MKRIFAAVVVSLAVVAIAETLFPNPPVGVTLADAATVSQNLSVQVTLVQAPIALSFAPAGPVNVTDTAAPGTVVAAVQVSTNDGQPFTGTLSISSQSTTGMVSLSAVSIPSSIQIASVNARNNGPQSVTVAACDNSGVHCVSGTLGMDVASPPPSSTILSSDRDASANWKMAGMLSVGGIPNRTTVCATITPRGAGHNDTASINTAIANCPAGQVVQLGAGTFTIDEGSSVLLSKGVTVRGAGAGRTILHRVGGATVDSYFPGSSPTPVITVGPSQQGSGFTGSGTTLAADAAPGSYSVQVPSTAGFAVGQMVLLDEASGASWQPDRIWAKYQIWASPDYRVVWPKHNPSYQDVDDFGAGEYPYTAGTAGCWFSNCDRPTNEMHKVASISGNTITFDSPVTISYRTSHQAKLYYWTVANTTQNAGVENLTVEYGDDGNIRITDCMYCWVQNVENRAWLGHGFAITHSFRVQLEGVYVHNAAWPVNGGGGYAIAINWGSSEVLIENSISMLANKVLVAQSAGTGSVIAYNYMDDAYINGSDFWIEAGLNASHMAGPHHVLFEGNQSFNTDSDQTHGNSIYMTFLRNWITGYRAPFTALDGTRVDDSAGCCGYQRAASAHAYAYWFSFIGNVLGTLGKMSGWVYEGKGDVNEFPPTAVWALGWMDIVPQGYDANVAQTAIRHGNFDYLSNSVNWDTNISSQSLPNSLYLTQKPAFFNAGKGYTWPWVDPIGGTKLYTLPAKARYDAGTPFAQP